MAVHRALLAGEEVNSWLFGVNVQGDPDDAIRRAPASYRGVCEPWNSN